VTFGGPDVLTAALNGSVSVAGANAHSLYLPIIILNHPQEA